MRIQDQHQSKRILSQVRPSSRRTLSRHHRVTRETGKQPVSTQPLSQRRLGGTLSDSRRVRGKVVVTSSQLLLMRTRLLRTSVTLHLACTDDDRNLLADPREDHRTIGPLQSSTLHHSLQQNPLFVAHVSMHDDRPRAQPRYPDLRRLRSQLAHPLLCRPQLSVILISPPQAQN